MRITSTMFCSRARGRASASLLVGLSLATASAYAQEPKVEAPKAETAKPTEPAAEAAAPAQESASATPDVSALSVELSAVLDELIQARTRASVLAKSLFRTRIDINVLRRADDQQVVHVRLALDGVPVHDSDGAALGRDEARLFQGYVAPGVHEIGIEIVEQSRQNPTYQYTRSERFRIETKKDTSTRVDVLLRDDSDMAEELPTGDDGKYQVSTRVRVTPVKVGD